MKNRDLLVKQIEREQRYCDTQEIGTEEYEKSFKRLKVLRDELMEVEKFEADSDRKDRDLSETKKDHRNKNIIEVVKVVGTGMVMPAIGFVVITAFEKDDSFTTSLKRTLDAFIPKRMN